MMVSSETKLIHQAILGVDEMTNTMQSFLLVSCLVLSCLLSNQNIDMLNQLNSIPITSWLGDKHHLSSVRTHRMGELDSLPRNQSRTRKRENRVGKIKAGRVSQCAGLWKNPAYSWVRCFKSKAASDCHDCDRSLNRTPVARHENVNGSSTIPKL